MEFLTSDITQTIKALFQAESRPRRMLAASQSYTSSGSTTCFKDYEYTSGMNKVCRYDCLGQDHAITIGAAHLCPLTVKR